MPESGQVSGTIFLRPVRVGLVFKPNLESIVRAVESATTSWGGIFHVLLQPEPADASLALARSLGVDVIWPMDGESLSERLSIAPGFHWTGWTGPFEASDSTIDSPLLDPSWLLDDVSGSSLVLPRWSEDDPLRELFAVWFGVYPDSGPGRELAGLYTERAEEVDLDPFGPVPSLPGSLTPIELTRLEIEYQGEYAPTGIMVLDPRNPADLMLLSNLRALGGAVFPWPLGFEARFEPAAEAWLTEMYSAGKIHSARSGAGVDLGPFIDIWFGERLEEIPADLSGLLDRHRMRVHPSVFERPRWWTGHHPLNTQLSRPFTALVDGNEHRFTVPLPSFSGLYRQRKKKGGVVAAQVAIYSETGLGPFWSASVPNVRDLAPLLHGFVNLGEPFHYPTHDGHALGVSTDAESVDVDLVTPIRIFDQLLRDSGWKCSQSDDGRFATRLIELLGGAATEVANQPAVRAVVQKAARTQNGLPWPALVQEAKQNAGAWPRLVTGARQIDYPVWVVNYLLSRKILHAVLPVKCPNCATISPLRPDDLATELTCALCSQPYPLGLALASKRLAWQYRLAAHVPHQRLSEALPVMAAVSVLSSFDSFSARAVPHVLGLELSGPTSACEVDIALAMNDGGPAIVVVGEVKSLVTPIDARDLANLEAVQRHLRTKGIDCYVLAATLREALDPNETADLRTFCEGSPSVVRSLVLAPLLPVILTAKDLSVPRHSDDHPTSWERPQRGMANLALESCRRNLGLIEATYQPRGDGDGWRFRWAGLDPPSGLAGE